MLSLRRDLMDAEQKHPSIKMQVFGVGFCGPRKTFAFDFLGFKWLRRLTYSCLLDFIVNCVVFSVTLNPKYIFALVWSL